MRRLKLLLSVLLVTFSVASAAHQTKASITKVLFNPRTDNIEVMHRFYVHDAEHAVKLIFGSKADILTDTATQQQFADYVTQRFSLLNGDQEMPLNLVGFEVDGKFIWVYQETQQPAKIGTLSVVHNALREIWPSQVNTINFEGKGRVQTLTFKDSVELLEVDLGH